MTETCPPRLVVHRSLLGRNPTNPPSPHRVRSNSLLIPSPSHPIIITRRYVENQQHQISARGRFPKKTNQNTRSYVTTEIRYCTEDRRVRRDGSISRRHPRARAWGLHWMGKTGVLSLQIRYPLWKIGMCTCMYMHILTEYTIGQMKIQFQGNLLQIDS